MHALHIRRPPDGVGEEVPFPRPHRGRIQCEAQSLLASPRLLFGAHALDGKCHLRRNHRRQLLLLGREHVRLLKIQHELPDHASEAHERNERHGGDAFRLDRRHERVERRLQGDVGNDDRFGIRSVGRPWRVPFHRAAVGAGQPPMRLETHHAVRIEQENCGPRHPYTVGEGIQRGAVDFLDGPDSADGRRQGKAHGNLRVEKTDHHCIPDAAILTSADDAFAH